MIYVYIAGPYTGDTHDYNSYFQIERNIVNAAQAAAVLASLGYGFFCPHLHSAHFEVITPHIKPSYWYDLDVHFLRGCDALLLLAGWENSRGSKMEKDLATSWSMPVFYSVPELVEKMPLSPLQEGPG